MTAEVLVHKALIMGKAERYGVPPSLVAAVVEAESAGNPNAVSPAGAQGLMQLMPATARRLGVADPFDPAQNIDGGVRFLREQLDTFDGNYPWAVAGYNAGPGAVQHAQDIPPYAETKAYVGIVARLLLDYLFLDGELIWGANPVHAPVAGSWREAAVNILGVADARAASARTAIGVLQATV